MNLRHVLPIGAFALTISSGLSAQGAPQPDGAILFRTRCGSCHTVQPGARPTIGPNLSGVVGRKAASTVFNYSPALKASNLVWTRANLDRYLSGPARMVPGTRMVIAMPDARQRAAILNFLSLPAK